MCVAYGRAICAAAGLAPPALGEDPNPNPHPHPHPNPDPDPTPTPKPSPNPNPSPHPNQDFRAYRIAYKAILRLEGFCRSWEIRRAYAEVKAASLVIARYARTYLAHQKFLEFREEEGLRTEVEEGPRT